ncbi:MAG: 50S ribosomal protein L18 [Oscillospiraceae bacterium]|nr:50S ribosomal protein L18 [Oscillospiraceae bacterium]
MIKKHDANKARLKRHCRIRNKLSGTALRPRLNVFRSSKHIYAQLIDDAAGKTLAAASSMDKGFDGAGSNKEAAKKVGMSLAEKAAKAGISEVIFDRGGYIFHGRVKELADGAREGGLKF